MNVADPTELALLHEVYGCNKCADEKFASVFTPAPSGSFFKFPPLIGGTGKLKLLFVGYNPRRTTNKTIHNFAMGSFKNFCALSDNINHLGDKYIGSPPTAPDHEDHYDLHNEIVRRVFSKTFEEVAAVTEMFLCASKDGRLLQTRNSPCARQYLIRTVGISDPEYIITFGVGLPRFFTKFVSGIRASVFHLPFPSNRSAPEAVMKTAVDWAVSGLIAMQRGQPPPAMNWKWPSADPKLPQGVKHYR